MSNDLPMDPRSGMTEEELERFNEIQDMIASIPETYDSYLKELASSFTPEKDILYYLRIAYLLGSVSGEGFLDELYQ